MIAAPITSDRRDRQRLLDHLGDGELVVVVGPEVAVQRVAR